MESPQTGIAKLQQTHDISKHPVPRDFRNINTLQDFKTEELPVIEKTCNKQSGVVANSELPHVVCMESFFNIKAAIKI